MRIYFRDILLIRISRGANNCVQRVFEKKHLLHYDISPQFKFLLSDERLDFCELIVNKRSKGLTMQIHFHSILWSYLPRVPIFLAMILHTLKT